MNLKYIPFIILLALFISYMPFGCQFAEAQEELSNPLKAQPKDVAEGIFFWIFNFGFTALFSILVFFFISYFFILLGLKIIKIERVTRSKIVVYIFVMFLIGFFLQPIVNKSLADAVNTPILYLINSLISFGITLAILKYYFSLFGKKLWLFFLYLVIINLIFLGLGILLL